MGWRNVIVVETAAVLLVLACAAVLPAYAYTGSYSDSLSGDKSVVSKYAQLDVCDATGEPLADAMFADSSISYSTGVLAESVLIDGDCTLKINNNFGTPEARPGLDTFLVRYDSQHPADDDVIPLKIVISTGPIDMGSLDPSSIKDLTVPENQSYLGDEVESYVAPTSGDSLYYIYLKTGTSDAANPIKLTGNHTITLTFSAVFADGSAVAASNNNTVKIGVSEYIEPSSGEDGEVNGAITSDVFVNPDDNTEEYPAADIHYGDEENPNAVGQNGTTSNFIIDEDIPFCIYYRIKGNSNHTTMTFSVSVGDGVPLTSDVIHAPNGNKEANGFIGLKFNASSDPIGLDVYASLNALKSANAWITVTTNPEEGEDCNFTLTLTGGTHNGLAEAKVIFNPPLTSP